MGIVIIAFAVKTPYSYPPAGCLSQRFPYGRYRHTTPSSSIPNRSRFHEGWRYSPELCCRTDNRETIIHFLNEKKPSIKGISPHDTWLFYIENISTLAVILCNSSKLSDIRTSGKFMVWRSKKMKLSLQQVDLYLPYRNGGIYGHPNKRYRLSVSCAYIFPLHIHAIPSYKNNKNKSEEQYIYC